VLAALRTKVGNWGNGALSKNGGKKLRKERPEKCILCPLERGGGSSTDIVLKNGLPARVTVKEKLIVAKR